MKKILSRIGKPIGSQSESATEPVYRGSTKHKNRPADGAKGTLCPEWTHRSHVGGLGTDMREHSWKTTRAAAMFADATLDRESRRRFATENGIAFEARPTQDGTWHGYPVPWEAVPPDIKDRWRDAGRVTKKQIKAFMQFEKSDIHWALRTDE